MRVESQRQMHNGGWWHPFDHAGPPPLFVKRQKKQYEPSPDFVALLESWRSNSIDRIHTLAEHLKLGVRALNELGTVYAKPYQAYAFPMYLPTGRVVGIRLRNDAGEKWAVKGSHAGLFIPFGRVGLPNGDLFICEGPTDTAAALSLGLYAIGRHACQGQEDMVGQVIEILKIKVVYICCDNDTPGLRGAQKLASTLKCQVRKFIPPAKDLREFVADGGTRELLFSIINGVTQ